MLSVQEAWAKLQIYLRKHSKEQYAPETIADCGDCYVFSVRLKSDPAGASTGLNPYIVYKDNGKVLYDVNLNFIPSMKPKRMISPRSI